MWRTKNLQICLVFFLIASAHCGPKYDDGGFLPSSLTYLEKTKASKAEDQVAMASQVEQNGPARRVETETNDITDRSQEPRFGFTNIGAAGSGYGVSPYQPANIDLGGLLLGAIIGVGSILIIPKLLYVLSGSYGAYARSDDNGFAQTMTKLDDALARHGIDTTSCMQRAVCTYSQQAAAAVRLADDAKEEEKATSFDRMVDAITNNQVFRTAMQGTAIQEAVEAGRAGRNCSRAYQHCGFSMETILTLISNIVSATTSANTRAPTLTTSPAL
ncbi:uncharacterized protein [Prorops nasuta]|uniref:uncharacterized protein n=1 Tax=Prorops nasuta TaxID=863751 RepID=UPI0034CF4000